MAIEHLISQNLRKAQAFDRNLTEAKQVDAAVSESADSVMFERDSSKRKEKIDKLVTKIGNIAEQDVIPQAERIGASNALDIIKHTDPPRGVSGAVQLDNGESVRMVKPKWFDGRKHSVVNVDLKKVIDTIAAESPTFALGAGGTGETAVQGRYENVGAHIAKGGNLDYPKLVSHRGQIAIDDGRHRIRYLYDHGVTTLPVAVPKGDARFFRSKFASKESAAALDETARRQALFQGRQRAKTRINIIKRSLEASGAKLDASLEKFWQEPSEGSYKDKLERLRQIHSELEQKRREYDSQMTAYHEGKINKRPSAPRLDFISALTIEAKAEIRTQARRTGTDAERAIFNARGHNRFVWITPNGENACPDCVNRQGVILSDNDWEKYGRPGSGLTVCESHCFCMLLPEETLKRSPSLTAKYSNSTKPGPKTSAAALAIFNVNRAR